MAVGTIATGLHLLPVKNDCVCCNVLERQVKYCTYNDVCSCLLAAAISLDSWGDGDCRRSPIVSSTPWPVNPLLRRLLHWDWGRRRMSLTIIVC